MTTIINNIIDSLIKQKRKLPQAMIIIFIYTIFFPNEVINVKDILISIIQIILPESMKEHILQLHFTQQELLSIWAFLLVIFMFVVILDVIKQLLKGQTYLFIDSSGGILFEINSIIFLWILIYNTLNYPGIKISSFLASTFYSYILVISGIIFFILFVNTYCTGIILIYQKINNFYSFRKQSSILLLKGVYFIIIIYIIIKIGYIILR